MIKLNKEELEKVVSDLALSIEKLEISNNNCKINTSHNMKSVESINESSIELLETIKKYKTLTKTDLNKIVAGVQVVVDIDKELASSIKKESF